MVNFKHYLSLFTWVSKLYVPLNSKLPPPPRHTPGIWLEFCSIQWGIWPKMCPPPPHPSQAFDFMPKHWSALQAKGFSLFWLCLVGYLHLNKQFDAWENFWIVGEGFDTFWSTSWYIWGLLIWPSKLPKYQGISPKFWQKSQMPGGGGGCLGWGVSWAVLE